MKESMDVLSTVTNAITLLLLAIVAISLVVGGVGITNILYVVVTERTSEIGLRKAVGATYKDIMLQILFESILITMLAGLVGIIIGIGAAYLISILAKNYGLAWRFVVPIQAYLTAIIFSLIFGVLFGLFPARKAARLQPIEAMRKE
jgi:putative ABC transport system permease protein